ncbi:hypothetical protein [Alteromonas sp. CYL-A6]|uniref:hypothetical protein n=1 Tax=Alteromonas nitratireducens TaxID=3390813 RepID=UPI0034C0E97D
MKTSAKVALGLWLFAWCIWMLLHAVDSHAAVSPGDPPRPLFRSDDIVDIDLIVPELRKLTMLAPKSVEPRSMQLRFQHQGETYLVDGLVQARGNSRRDPSVCSFPPLRLLFEKKLKHVPLFKGHKKIKLVTHCQRRSLFEQLMLREYAAYKLMNEISPVSLRVRPVRIRYHTDPDKSPSLVKLGFFIEDIDDLAKRHGLREFDTTRVTATQLEKDATMQFALFQYLIANLDYSPTLPKEGDSCCHNVKLLLPYRFMQAKPDSVVPVAYDFDYSGFVDAPYAINPAGIPLSTRVYRGVCAHHESVEAYRADILAIRDRLFAVIDAVPETTEKNRRVMREFLTTSLSLLASPDFTEKMNKFCVS